MINKDTKNKSFIHAWRYLQDNNVDNNSFMLKLINEDLKKFKTEDLEIDDKKHRKKLIDMVYEECKNNIWFFFREIIKIPSILSFNGNYIPEYPNYILNPIEMSMIWLYDNDISFLAKRNIYMNNKNNVLHKGVQTTLTLLEIYNSIFKNDDYQILNTNISTSYIRNDIYKTNDFFAKSIDFFESEDTNSNEIFNILNLNTTKNTFMYINNNDINISNLYNFMYINKYENSKKNFGCYNSDSKIFKFDDENKEIISYKKIINNCLFDIIDYDIYKQIFDNINEIKTKNKIMLI